MPISIMSSWQTSPLRYALARAGIVGANAANIQSILKRVRRFSKDQGRFSWTSDAYQADIVRFILENRRAGRGIVEVGCFRGGLSAQLAFLCQQLGWPFYTMDVDPTAVKSTAELLGWLNLHRHSHVFPGSLQEFTKATKLSARPALIVIDGDHCYDAVVRDIHSLYQLNHLPHAAAFHDFSLRHPTTGERVDQAIRHTFGEGLHITKIGTQISGSGDFPTVDAPAEDGHYWAVPGSEGAIIRLPFRLPSRT